MQVKAWATQSAGAPLAPWHVERRAVGAQDVQLEILSSGICHSDVHQARGEWGGARFPMVPGHEIVGRVTAVGAEVTRFAVGDLAGIGCLVDSCHACRFCRTDHEQFCERGAAGTYNSTEMDRVTPTYGGYSTDIVVTERFALKIPTRLDLHTTPPLLCAGITTYSPLRRHGCGPGSKVAVVGLGGLGHMAVKLAAAMGAEVTLFSSTASKAVDAQRLGAAHFAHTADASTFTRHKDHFDLIIDTVSATHDIAAHLATLAPRGTMVLVGAPPDPFQLHAFSLIGGARSLVGSIIGGIAETQEVLDFCGRHNLGADVEVIAAQDINAAYDRMVKSDVRYRFVIDGATLR